MTNTDERREQGQEQEQGREQAGWQAGRGRVWLWDRGVAGVPSSVDEWHRVGSVSCWDGLAGEWTSHDEWFWAVGPVGAGPEGDGRGQRALARAVVRAWDRMAWEKEPRDTRISSVKVIDDYHTIVVAEDTDTGERVIYHIHEWAL